MEKTVERSGNQASLPILAPLPIQEGCENPNGLPYRPAEESKNLLLIPKIALDSHNREHSDAHYYTLRNLHNFDVNLKNPRSPKPLRPGGHPGFGQGVSATARKEELQRGDGMKIAQTAVQSIGMSTKDPWGPPISRPQYALAVSLIFTKAANQAIMLGTPPKHVLSTSILWASLVHDKRFEQVPMSEAAPGDIIIGSGWQQGADGYAGIVGDHGRIVSNSSQGVQDNSSLAELQRNHPGMVLFRYVGFRNFYRSRQLSNAGYNPDESRVSAGQPGGGQWTAGGAGAKAEGPQIAFGGRQTTETEAVKALWAAVIESINAGGQHPTRAQLEQFSEAFDALQKYLVDHGMTPEEAFEAVSNAVRNLTHPGSGPNPGSEGVLGTYLGKPAGADIAQIFAAAILGRSNLPSKNSNAKPPDEGADAQNLGKQASKPTVLKPYSEDGGHHIPAKRVFEGDPAYNPSEVLAIPNAELKALGLRHTTITGAQKTLYSAYAKLGKPLTWEAVESIETQALVKSGLDPARAAATVSETIKALIASGVKEPTRIPWGGK